MQAAATSSTRCVETTTVAAVPNSLSSERKSTRCSGSRPAVGSSSSSSSGSFTTAWAIPARRTIPPESVFIFVSIRSPSPTRRTARSTAAGTRSDGISLSQATYATNSRTVKPG